MNSDELDKLRNENEALRNENENLKRNNARFWNGQWWITKKIGGIFLGGLLSNSIKKLFDEISSKNITKETLGDVATHILWRFTRIGIFAIFIALLPTMFAALQTYYLYQQNKKIDAQNRRIEQQTYLQEAERRGSLVFLFDNVLDKIDEELKDKKNIKRELSPQLIGRIVALSKALKPYQYLENGDLIDKPISPERGQLLLSLLSSKLSRQTYDNIYKNADFSYADLKNANLDNCYLKQVNLSNSDFTNVDMESSFFQNANLTYCKFEEVRTGYDDYPTSRANFRECDFSNSTITYTHFLGCRLENTKFQNVKFQNVSFDYCNFREYLFQNCSFIEVGFEFSTFIDTEIFEKAASENCFFSNVTIYQCLVNDTTVVNKIISNYPFFKSLRVDGKSKYPYETIDTTINSSNDFWCDTINYKLYFIDDGKQE